MGRSGMACRSQNAKTFTSSRFFGKPTRPTRHRHHRRRAAWCLRSTARPVCTMTATSDFEELPDELLVLILGQLDPVSLSRVKEWNHYWKSFVEDNAAELWRSVLVSVGIELNRRALAGLDDSGEAREASAASPPASSLFARHESLTRATRFVRSPVVRSQCGVRCRSPESLVVVSAARRAGL